ncbi:MAG: FG-GAP-like repeat-containing protein, partial [Planctomycetota bacterium]|nr:FG-GAP-like repeat-containing protein [Planctomycetota bacterium]
MSNLPICPRIDLARRSYLSPSPLRGPALLALLLLPASCGFGSAAVASTTGNGQGNASPVVGDVSVVDPSAPTRRAATSPAQVRFRLTDEDGDASSVSIDYSTDGGASFRPITTPTTLTDLAPGDYDVVWNYGGDLGGESFKSDVQLRVTAAGGNAVLAAPFDIGNDAPEIDPAAFTLPAADPEPEGTVQVGFAVRDSAGDQVDIRVEFNRDAGGGFPEASWQLARAVGVDASTDTPLFALNNLEPPASGQTLPRDFFWESDFDPAPNAGVSEQMAYLDSDVKLRFMAMDEFGAEGAAVETDVFRVDNNAVPRAVLNEISFVSVKDRGNIPLRFRIFDRESDDVQVAIQWRSIGQAFPLARNSAGQQVNLATLSRDEIEDLLENPARDQDRRDAQIAREAAPAFQGRLGALEAGLAADEVRLAEVAGSQAGLLAMGIEGRALEILRPARPEAAQWSATALNSPVDAHVLGQGLTALVLDQAGGSSGWQVREIDLETGAVFSTFAQGSGAPKSMDVDPMDRTLFVASSTHVFRFELHTRQPLGVPMSHSFADGPRGLAALGDEVVLATGDVSDGVSVDGQLRRLDFSPGSTTPDEALLSGLSEPWGLALDPMRSTGLYLAERTYDNGGGDPQGRVVTVDLDQMTLAPIPALVSSGALSELGATPFPSPTSIALEGGGRQLLAVTEWNNSAGLRRVGLRSPWDVSQPSDGRADPFVEQVTALNESVGGLVTGPDRLRVVTLPASNLLTIGGGVAQRRSIQAYDPTTQVVTLDGALNPAPAAGAATEWRVRTPLREPSGSPEGEPFAFVWDSTEIPDPASVKIRVIAQDIDPGIPGTSAQARSYRPSFDPAAPLVSAPAGLRPRSTTTADLDGDGDMDLVSVNEDANNLTLYFQTRPGLFEQAASTLPTGTNPRHVIAADLDGDGDVDLVSADHNSDSLTLFFQTNPGDFTQQTATLPVGANPWAITAADLDGDGDMDLAAANSGDSTLTLHFQTSPQVYAQPATTLSTGTNPRSVTAADLDADGDLDLASANYVGNTVSLFWQTNPGVFNPT